MLKKNFSRLTLQAGALVAATLAAVPTANAWVHWHCGPYNATQYLTRNTCQSPNFTSEATTIADGKNRWARLTGVRKIWHDTIIETTGSGCAMLGQHGLFEIAAVPSSTPGLQGSAGQWYEKGTPQTVNGCTRIGGSVILINEDYVGNQLDVLNAGLGGREVVLHELGHAMGMGHEETWFSVMCSAPQTCGKFTSQNRFGNSLSGNVGAEYFLPDDVNFMKSIHDTSTVGRVDPALSPWNKENTSIAVVLNHPGNPLVNVCRGANSSVKITAANLGSEHLNVASLWVVLSSDSLISRNDFVVNNAASFWATPGTVVTGFVGFNVPFNAPLGIQRVGLVADPDDVLVEDNEYNNGLYTGLRINVVNCP